MKKVLRTKRRILLVETNEDGTLKLLSSDGTPIEDAGAFIISCGGIQSLLSKCKDYTDEEWNAICAQMAESKRLSETPEYKEHLRNAKAAKEAERSAEIEREYKEVFSGNIIESTPDNIYVLLRYLNEKNWGAWDLPKMTIGFSCAQYDCDGKQATTIKLDRPIEFEEEMVDKFQFGAPFGHLKNYHRIYKL